MIHYLGIYKKIQKLICSQIHEISPYINFIDYNIDVTNSGYSEIPSNTAAKAVPHKIDYG